MPAHVFLDDADRCLHCSTLKSSVNHIACPGPQYPAHGEQLRPEPTRREPVSTDYDTIGARVAELYAEKTAAMNEPAKDDAT